MECAPVGLGGLLPELVSDREVIRINPLTGRKLGAFVLRTLVTPRVLSASAQIKTVQVKLFTLALFIWRW